MGYDRDRSLGFRSVIARAGLGAMVCGAAGLVVVGAAPTAASAQQAAAVTSLVFDGVNVVDVEQGKLVPNQRVVIVGNRIQAVGGTGEVKTPQGARVVDAKDKYLIPGLWDLHTHPGRSTDLFYPLFLANGVTGIRDAGSPVPLDTLLRWRREILAGARVGPVRQILSGQSMASSGYSDFGPPAWCKRGTGKGPQTCVADSADAVHYVDSIRAAGADMIKPRAVNKAAYLAIAAEAQRLGVPFGGHAQGGSEWITVLEASNSGASIIDHELGGESCIRMSSRFSVNQQCQESAEQFRRTGTWFVPTLIASSQFAGRPAGTIRAHMIKRANEFWAGSRLPGDWLRNSFRSPTDSSGNMYLAQRVGLLILAGTDVRGSDQWNEWEMRRRGMSPVYQWSRNSAAGFELHAELATFVAEGMAPLEALRAATLNPAKMLHGTDSLGTVAAGKLADLVLLDADPLVDITNTTTIWAVVANGRYFDRAALDRVLTEVQAKAEGQGQP